MRGVSKVSAVRCCRRGSGVEGASGASRRHQARAELLVPKSMPMAYWGEGVDMSERVGEGDIAVDFGLHNLQRNRVNDAKPAAVNFF